MRAPRVPLTHGEPTNPVEGSGYTVWTSDGAVLYTRCQLAEVDHGCLTLRKDKNQGVWLAFAPHEWRRFEWRGR